MLSGKMLKILLLFSSCVAVFILECQVYGTIIARCDGQMDTGDFFSVNYTAINSHCNCTILPRYDGSLKFASNTIQKNCYTEITIHELPELNSTLIPCKGERQTPTFKVTQDSLFYMTSRSVNITSAPQRFLQNIRIFGIADDNSSKALISVTCGATLQSSSAKPSDVITTADNGYSSTTGANGNFVTKTSHLESIQPPSTTEEIQFCPKIFWIQILHDYSIFIQKAKHSFVTKTSPDAVSTYSKKDLENIQPPSTTEEIQYSIFVAVGSGIVVIAVVFVMIFCIRRRTHERGTNKSDKLLCGGQRNVASGNKELPYNPLYHQFNNEADGGYSTMEDVNRSPCDELPDNPLYLSHQENTKASGPASMVEEKTGKEDIPMLETGSNAIYAQPNKVPKGPKSEVEDISQTENVYAQVKKLDKK
ncbi:uncharacterized protein [Magallana gigas]|uniref:uncharacterized protein isoform X2 n=1 Tax=Magallana gigas TaxID=29159 RepID=UPI00333EA762